MHTSDRALNFMRLFVPIGRRDIVECLSPGHLHADGCSGRATGSSLQQLEHNPVKVSDAISPQEGENMEVCS